VTGGFYFSIDEEAGTSALLSSASLGLNALGLGPQGVLYGAAFTGEVYEIDPLTGTGTLLATITGFFSAGDLAVDGRTLFMTAFSGTSGGEDLYRYDLDTGVGGLVGPIGFNFVFSLVFGDGALLGLSRDGAVIEIDRATGAGAQVGTAVTAGRIEGAALVPGSTTTIPLPGALPLLLAGLGGLAMARRRGR